MPKLLNSQKRDGVAKKMSGQGKMANDGDKRVRAAKPLFARERNYTPFLYKILKKVHPEVGANKESMDTFNSIILHFYEEIAKEAAKVSKKGNKSTLSALDVQTAAKIVLPQELALHSVSSAAGSVKKYEASRKSDKNE